MYALLLFTLLIVSFFIIFWLIQPSPISTIFLQMTQCFSVSKLHTQTHTHGHTHIPVEEHRLIKKLVCWQQKTSVSMLNWLRGLEMTFHWPSQHELNVFIHHYENISHNDKLLVSQDALYFSTEL